MSGTGWGAAAPILRVRDLDASHEYYLKVLGFKQDWRGEWLDASGRTWRRFAGGEWTQDAR
jgi:catechol 2,3-dioxygenase-like lactoylglutathione lyase family enzyme